jgi:hypothetical protein
VQQTDGLDCQDASALKQSTDGSDTYHALISSGPLGTGVLSAHAVPLPLQQAGPQTPRVSHGTTAVVGQIDRILDAYVVT